MKITNILARRQELFFINHRLALQVIMVGHVCRHDTLSKIILQETVENR